MWQVLNTSGNGPTPLVGVRVRGGLSKRFDLTIKSIGGKERLARESVPIRTTIVLSQTVGDDFSLLDLFRLGEGIKLKLTRQEVIGQDDGPAVATDVLDVNASDLVAESIDLVDDEWIATFSTISPLELVPLLKP